MFDQHDVKVVDDNLAGEKHNRLHTFPECDRYSWCTHGLPTRTWFCQEVRSDDGNYAGEYRPFHPQTDLDQQVRANQAHHSFQHEVNGERTERVNSLDIASADSEWNVENHS